MRDQNPIVEETKIQYFTENRSELNNQSSCSLWSEAKYPFHDVWTVQTPSLRLRSPSVQRSSLFHFKPERRKTPNLAADIQTGCTISNFDIVYLRVVVRVGPFRLNWQVWIQGPFLKKLYFQFKFTHNMFYKCWLIRADGSILQNIKGWSLSQKLRVGGQCKNRGCLCKLSQAKASTWLGSVWGKN